MHPLQPNSKVVCVFSSTRPKPLLVNLALLAVGLLGSGQLAVKSALALNPVPQASSTPGTGQFAQTPTPAPTHSDRITRPTLRLGSQGDAVSELQAMLQLLGFYPDSVSGQFQESTQDAVKQFQSAAGLTPDGIVGSATWSELLPTPPSEANPPNAISTPANTATQPASQAPAAPSSTASSSPKPASSSSSSSSTSSSSSSPPSSSRPSSPPVAASDLPVLRPGMQGAAVTRLQERLKSLGFYRGTIDGVFGTETEQAVKQAQRHYGLEADGIVGPATWDAILP